MNVAVFDDAETLAAGAADAVAEAAAIAIDERGRFTFAVSGGSTPRRMLERLAVRDDIDWSCVHLFQVDERIAPDGDPARNATMLREALLTESFLERNELGGVWLMPVTLEPDEAVATYAATIDALTGSPVVFDLVQLGLGDDGHTASLIPGDPVLDVVDRDVAVTDVYRGHRRLTLTWPVLDRAKAQLWVVAGEAKREAVAAYLENDRSIPATLPSQSRATFLVDAAAYRSD